MKRLYVVVEGETERQLISKVIGPHMRGLGIETSPIIVETSRDSIGRKRKGGGDWTKWRKDILKIKNEHSGNDVRITSLFDLYNLPSNFPQLSACGSLASTILRAEKLEFAMAAEINDWRFIPYLQRHEFEALVLVGLDNLNALLDPSEHHGLQLVRNSVQGLSPEDVNDGEDTAPSKRLQSNIPSYQKTVHGPLVVEEVGLAAIRATCPRLNAWVAKLEGLAAGVAA